MSWRSDTNRLLMQLVTLWSRWNQHSFTSACLVINCGSSAASWPRHPCSGGGILWGLEQRARAGITTTVPIQSVPTCESRPLLRSCHVQTCLRHSCRHNMKARIHPFSSASWFWFPFCNGRGTQTETCACWKVGNRKFCLICTFPVSDEKWEI